MNLIIKELKLEEYIILLDEYIDSFNIIIWQQRKQFLKYCLDDYKYSFSNIVNSVGYIISSELIEEIIGSEDAKLLNSNKNKCKPNCSNKIFINFYNIIVPAFEY
jgi:hypothetical protein